VYSLRLYSPILQGQTFVGELGGMATNWRRSIRAMGGFWQGSLTLEAPISVLEQFFYEYLAFHFEERCSGTITWEGLVYEMDLNRGDGHPPRKRSLDLMANAVKATYAHDNGISETAWATLDASIKRYGRKDEWISLDNYPQTVAEKRRDTLLNQVAWPWPRPQKSLSQTKPSLQVTVCGYVFTANWKFTALAASGDTAVSTYIPLLVGETQFLTASKVSTNGLLIRQKSNTP
jgi:hypothetical protein